MEKLKTIEVRQRTTTKNNNELSKERLLLVTTLDGRVSAIDSATGGILWSFGTGSSLVHASSSSSSSSSSNSLNEYDDDDDDG